MMVTIARVAYDAMIEHFQQAAPNEGCGLLAGPNLPCPRDTDGDGDCGRRHCPDCGPERVRRADTWFPLANIAEHSRVRFEVGPMSLLYAWQALADEGRRPWVVAHSHVTSAAFPSPHDIRYATDPTLLHLIVSLAGPAPHARLWRLDPHAPDPARQVIRVLYEVVDLDFQENPATDLTRGVPND